MMLSTFEEFVSACLSTGVEYRFLYVYMKLSASLPEAEMRTLFPDAEVTGLQNIGTIMFDAHEPVKPGLTFDEMRKCADGYSPDWDVVFVTAAKSGNDAPLTDDDVKEFLADMRERIMAGNFPHNAPIFDREGNLKSIDRAQPLQVRDSGQSVN